MKVPKIWKRSDSGTAETKPPQVVQIDIGEDQLREMSAVFAAPRWVRDLGIAAWLLVGIAALFVGLIWLLALTATITVPVIIGLVLATVAAPLVTWLHGKGAPRALGAALVLLGFVALGVVIVLLVVGGIVGQESEIKSAVNGAADTIQGWLEDAGVDEAGAASANENTSKGVADTLSTFVSGLAGFVGGITSLVFFVVFTVFSLFFLLKDGPKTREWIDGHIGVPRDVAQTITGNVIKALRRYFYGRLDRRCVQRDRRRRRSAHPRRAPGRHDRRRHVRDGVHPVHRRVRLGRVRGAHRAWARRARRPP